MLSQKTLKKQQRKSERKITAKQGRSHQLSPVKRGRCEWRIFEGSHGFQDEVRFKEAVCLISW